MDLVNAHLDGLHRLAAHLLCAGQLPGGIVAAGGKGGLSGAEKLAVLAAVVDLQRAVGAEALAHEGKFAQRQDALIAAEVQLQLLVHAVVDVHHHVAHGQYGRAAPGDGAIQVHKAVRHQMVRRAEIQRGRGQLDAVFEVNTADADGGKDMGVSCRHSLFPFSLIQEKTAQSAVFSQIGRFQGL